jgi:hypothetical protein
MAPMNLRGFAGSKAQNETIIKKYKYFNNLAFICCKGERRWD